MTTEPDEPRWLCDIVPDSTRDLHEYWNALCRRQLVTEGQDAIEDVDVAYVVIEMPDGQWFVSPNKWGLDHSHDIGPYVSFTKAAQAAEMLMAQEGEGT